MKIRIEWHTEKRNIKDLRPYDKNPRIIDEAGLKQLSESFDEIGYAQYININTDNTILSGHARYYQLKNEGVKEVDVLVPNRKLTSKEEEAVVIRMNKIHAGDWDFKKLDLDWDRDDILNWGFDESELLEVEIEKIPGCDEDEVPEVKGDPITKRGDVWLMGNHRVMCGDSTMIDDVDKLKGTLADSFYCDPPYGIKYSGKGQDGKIKANDFGMIKNDDTIDIAKDAWCLARGISDKLIFWGANFYPSILDEQCTWVVWNKKTIGEYYSDCELAATTFKGRIKMFEHQWHGMIKESERGQKRVHPTQKPIALAEWCFENYDMGDIICDLFLGSGSTLIACEKTNRKCYGMELDEHYCDVIINRWQQYTGESATLESTDWTYEEIKNRQT